ncbi:hypothetical protein ASA1KI_41840 [Opitutales bacterium ASA1]|uniref:sensor histidine kinase n=1 Tax=Congregicoccus parvus TaxID=3081749 RepID=UPI002B32583D|nr:hypothetical protein ASA1KI_41840 [Opitutales bacterium ASA1]
MAIPDSHSQESSAGSARAVVAGVVVLGVFATAVAVVNVQLRDQWRTRVLEREGEVVRAVAAMERARIVDTESALGAAVLDEPFEIALSTSRGWQGVLAVRVFDSDGRFMDGIPVETHEIVLADADLAALRSGSPLVRFHPHFRFADLFATALGEGGAPLLEVNIELPSSEDGAGEAALVQYWLDGVALSEELAAIDARVLRQALFAFATGALLIGGSLVWGFRRIAAVNRLLRLRAEDLARANRELAQSARTSAIGAITAHLVHGLRNPLAGLESFVSGQSGDGPPDGEWASARESTKRLRAIVNEVHGVLGDVESGADFEVSSHEVCVEVGKRFEATSARRGVRIEIVETGDCVLDARAAGLGTLVLANLIQNAVEASPEGAVVRVEVSNRDGRAEFLVGDTGPGLPADVARDPFRARRSTKPDGAGIGLAISSELARNAGGELAVARTGNDGTVFRLRLPARVFVQPEGKR